MSHRVAGRVYRIGVGLVGLGLLISQLRISTAPNSWATVGLFVLFSWAVKRAGFRVTEEVTHSLVNLVDVAAVLLLGPVDGALVSAASSGLYIVSWGARHRRLTEEELIEFSLFDAGVKVLMALLAGALYLAIGGAVPPALLDLRELGAVLVLFVAWFTLDHLFWIGQAIVSGGWRRGRHFLRAVLRASLLVELLPLPFSLIIVAGWVAFPPIARAMLLTAVLTAAIIVRLLAGALRRSRARLQVVSLLNDFGEAVVAAQLDEERLAVLLYDYVTRVAQVRRFALLLADEAGCFHPTHVAGEEVRLTPSIMDSLAGRLRAAPVPLTLPDLGRTTLATLPPLPASNGARWGSPNFARAVVAPLALGERLLGMTLIEGAESLTDEEIRTISTLSRQAAVALENARHFQQAQWRALQLQTISEVAQRVAAIIELDELLAQVVTLVKETFGYYHVQVYLVDRETQQVVFRAGSGPIGEALARHPPSFPVTDGERGIISWVAAHGEPLVVNDVLNEPRYIREDARLLPDTRAELAIPLMVETRVLGVLDVQGDAPHSFDEDDLFTLRTLGQQVAVAIEDARLYAAQREETWVTTALLQVAEAVSTLNRLSDVLETVSRITPIMTGAAATALYLWHESEARFEPAESYGLAQAGEQLFRQRAPAPADFPLLAQTCERQSVVTVEPVGESAMVPPPFAAMLCPDGEAPERLALIAAPLLAQGEAVGAMLLSFADGGHVDERRRALVAGIAQQAAVAIQAARLYAAQRDEAWITTALLQVAEAVASRSDLGEVLDLITRLTIMLAEVDHCGIYLWNAEPQRLDPAASYGIPAPLVAEWRANPLTLDDWTHLRQLTGATTPVVVAGGKGEAAARLAEIFGPVFVAAPLHAHGHFLGLLLVDLPRQRGGEGATAPVSLLSDRLRAMLSGIARQLSIAVENTRLYEEAIENERRTQELRLARQLQAALLPEQPPELPGYELAGYWLPAREVAGDFYDFFMASGDRFAFAIADVADKGMAAALFMVLTRSTLRESVWNKERVGAALGRTNHRLTADARGGMFVTCFLGLMEPATGALTVSNAGHLPPLIYDATTDGFASLALRNMPLGIFEDNFYHEVSLALTPGSFMVLYTDGITDTPDATEQLFGLKRLSEVVWHHRHASARAIIQAIREAASAFGGGEVEFDDQTIVVIKRLGPAPALQEEEDWTTS